MPGPDGPLIEELLDQASRGDASALGSLLDRHRAKLRRMLTVRMGAQLRARIDASDIIQETFLEASQKLHDYIQHRETPFYPWLRQLAWKRFADQCRRHLCAQRRATHREVFPEVALPDESTALLAEQLAANGSNPSHSSRREEERRQIREALDKLAARDRNVLVLRYLEELSTGEIANVLGITERGVRAQHRRALMRLGSLLGESLLEDNHG